MDNVLIISEDGTTIISCDKNYSGEVIIPDGIINIGAEAFANSAISKVVFPNSLKKIGRYAFQNCTTLQEVNMNNGIEDIDCFAFADCSSLSIINLPSSIKTLGRYGGVLNGNVFLNCISLKTFDIPYGVEYIADRTFKGCSNLKSINVPDTIKGIGSEAFDNCVSLNKVIISDLAKWCKINKYSNPLDYAHHLYSDNNTEIEYLAIPNSIDLIEGHTFRNCTGLKSVIIPEGVRIGLDAFKGCIGLKCITLKMKNVGYDLNEFKDCSNVEVIKIKHFAPNLCIGLQGFKKLKKIYSLDAADNETEIEVNAILNSKAKELKLMSMFYHNLDMNLTMVCGKYPDNLFDSSFKKPVEKEGMILDKMYVSKQDTQILLNIDWFRTSGMGLVLGWNDYRAIDFDYVDEDKLDTTINTCLQFLSLPSNYPWVVRSGSQKGFHIIIRVKDFCERDDAPISLAYMASNIRVELRWKGHLILPPSIHCSGGTYSFYFNQIPSTKPQYVELGFIDQLLDSFCGENHYQSYNWREINFMLIERQKNNAIDSQGVACYSSWREKDRDSVQWLETCKTAQAYNSLANKYLLGKDVPVNPQKAYDLLILANNDIAWFNLASLISIGFFKGTKQDVKKYLERIDQNQLSGRYWRDENGLCYYEDIASIVDNIRNQADKYLPEEVRESFLFFDTETTGVPRNYNAPSSDIQNWPRLVQLAWILTDDKGNRIHSSSLIVKPDGFTIPTDAAKVHGITTEIAMKEGIPLGKAINQFIEDLNTATYIVGHNIDFDKKIVGAEMIRLGMKDIMDSKKSFCTMQSSLDFCRIPGKYGYKYPKLQELYKKLFGCEFDNAHDAMSDIEATEKCFWELRKRKLI